MKKLTFLSLILLVALFFSACESKTENTMNDNPLLQEFTNEYGIPPFDKIKPEHFLPAFEFAMNEQLDNIDKIVNNTEEATFENTIVPYEFSGLLLSKISAIFYNLHEANTNPEIDSIAEQLTSLMTNHFAKINYNAELFDRIKTLFDKRDDLNLNQEQYKLLSDIYKDFMRAGVGLPEEQQQRLKEINEELSMLTLKFGKNNLDEINQYKLVVDNKEDLAGLPENLIQDAATRAKDAGLEGKYVFTIQKPVMIPFLQYSENRELRKEIYSAYFNLGDNDNEFDNKENINKIVNLRIEKSHILGYNNYAEFVLDKNMAKTPDKVYELLNNLWERALPVAEKEAQQMQQIIYDEGNNFKLESWDWWYYAEKLRKSKYNLDENEVMEYLPLESVQEILFTEVNKLYNLKIEKLENVPVPHPDAIAYKVSDATTGQYYGIIFMDFFTRESKRAGAWMDNYINQYIKDGKEQRPVITTVFNFAKASNGSTLLTMEQASTVFHEFGHALHGLLTQCTYLDNSGTDVARDFVEFPSQFMENWISEPAILKMYAKNYKTGEPIPDELIEKISAASKFNQGFNAVEYLAASILDMDYHTINEKTNIDVKVFENATMQRLHMPDNIIVRYRSTYFRHIFSGGYASGYYSYKWAEVLVADAFEAFRESGDYFDPKLAKLFKDNILEKGGTVDPMKLYINFRGQKPKIEPLLKQTGLM